MTLIIPTVAKYIFNFIRCSIEQQPHKKQLETITSNQSNIPFLLICKHMQRVLKESQKIF